MKSGVMVVALVGFTAAVELVAQETTPLPSAFEVASIRPTGSPSVFTSISGSVPSQFSATNATLAQILVMAFELRDIEQIVGGPSWIRVDGFDIVARYPSGYAASLLLAQLPAMVRTLLSERFNLRARVESKNGAIYVLKTARTDGTLGAGLRRTEVDCAKLLETGQLSVAPNPREPAPCTGRQSLQGRDRILTASALPMKQLAGMLSFAAGRDVVDRTELTGAFDAELRWTPDVTIPPLTRSSDGSGGVSLFTAVQEQLGLKLESAQGPIEVLAIDSVSRPTPD